MATFLVHQHRYYTPLEKRSWSKKVFFYKSMPIRNRLRYQREDVLLVKRRMPWFVIRDFNVGKNLPKKTIRF